MEIESVAKNEIFCAFFPFCLRLAALARQSSTDFSNVEEHRHKNDFNQFFWQGKRNWDELSSTYNHTPAVCCSHSTVAIPQTQDLTDTQVIKRDFSRKTNVECRQLAVVVFYNDEKGGNKFLGEILAEMTHWPLQDLHSRQLSVESISNIFDIYDSRSGRLWLDLEQ